MPDQLAIPDRLGKLVRRRYRPAWVTLLVLVALWLGIAVDLVEKHDLVLEGAAQSSRNLSTAFAENIRGTIESIDTTIRATRAARDHDPAHFSLAAWMRDSGLTSAVTWQISLADRDGHVVASNLGPVTTEISIGDRPHFIGARDQPDDELFIGRPVLGRVSRKWSVQLVRKLFDADGKFDGVIVASLDPAFLARFYQSLSIGRGAVILAGQDGVMRAAAPAQAAPLGADLSATPLMTEAAGAATGIIEMDATADHLSRIYGWRRLPPYGLLVAVGLSRADALRPYHTEMWVTLLIGLAMTLMAVWVSLALTCHRHALIGSRQIMQAAVSEISQGLVVIDAQGRVPLMNPRAIEMSGLPAELCAPGADMETLLNRQVETGELDASQATRLRRALRSQGGGQGREGRGLYQRTRRDGTVLEIHTRILPDGGAVSTLTDITAQQHAARLLAEARAAAEAAARARAAFLAVMSLEIRTSLNGLIGMAALLDALDLGPTERDHVRLIRNSGHHLVQLINEILDYSRLDAARVQGAVDLFRAPAGTTGLPLAATAAVPPASPTSPPDRLASAAPIAPSGAAPIAPSGAAPIAPPGAGKAAKPGDSNEAATVSPRLRELAADLGEAAVAEIIDAFAEDARSRLRTMRGSAERGERASLFREAHCMTCAARNVGAVALGVRAASLERDVARLSAEQIIAEIAALECELAVALDAMGIPPQQETQHRVLAV
jgi:HPt (histidine-containing phosphotransfer) domain-containing protein/PAS domain-containing protein